MHNKDKKPYRCRWKVSRTLGLWLHTYTANHPSKPHSIQSLWKVQDKIIFN